jgi:hypothetical protein
LLDIETTPALADVWGLWQQNVGLNQLRESPGLLCFAAKWLGAPKDPEYMYFVSDHHHGREAMVTEAHRLLDQADAVVTWHGKGFDVPHLNREFLELGLRPPAPFQHIDLYEVVKKRFRFPSNKLQYVSTALGFEGKATHEGHGLWVKCMEGDEDAWRRMEEYNKQDVWLLELLYNRLQPWVQQHPSHALKGEMVCPKCGSDRLQRRGMARTLQSEFQRYQCLACGGWCRETKRVSGAVVREIAA